MFLGKSFPNGNYSALKPEKLLLTLDKLERRIADRFPDSGLRQVAQEMRSVAQAVFRLSEKLSKPMWEVRIFTFIAIALLMGLTAFLATKAFQSLPAGESGLVELLQGVEAAINEIILLSLAVFFLASLEQRLKRRVALESLHRLRSISHVIDMHQLTKDPVYLLAGMPATQSSPERTYTQFELSRYFDYCTELLALSSKLAAFHLQHFQDSEVLKTVNEVEMLTHTLSDKIWQKIMLLDKTLPLPSPPAQQNSPSGGARPDD